VTCEDGLDNIRIVSIERGMKAWKADVQGKIKQGMDSIRAGRGIPAEQVKVQMAAFKKKWMEDRQSK
jgi:hypothetical protein